MSESSPYSKRFKKITSILIIALIVMIIFLFSPIVPVKNIKVESYQITTTVPTTVTITETYKVVTTSTYPVQEVVNRRLERVGDYWIGEYSYSGYNLEAGKTIEISWQADNFVIVYFMTESQYNMFVSTRLAQNLISKSGYSGSFSYQIPYNGKFYVVIYNPYYFFIKVKIIFYQSEVSGQETVWKTRTLTTTEYKTVTKIENREEVKTEYLTKTETQYVNPIEWWSNLFK
ncbi:MAG: hypothetical protein QXE05_11590 [Nitrososphaeria archaeon]